MTTNETAAAPLEMERLLTIKELSEMLAISVPTLYRWQETGRPMPRAIRLGQQLRWRLSEVHRYLDELMDEAA